MTILTKITSHTNSTTGGSSQTSTYNYNSLGWKLSETNAFGTVSYQYDNWGRRSRLTWPDGFYVTYDYNVGGYPSDLLQEIIEYNSAATLVSFDYDSFGRLDTLTRGNSVVSDYDYDEMLRLEALETDVAGANDDILEVLDYTVAGQIKSRTLGIENADYLYLPATKPAIAYVPNALNQIATIEGASLSYDGRGNLTTEVVIPTTITPTTCLHRQTNPE